MKSCYPLLRLSTIAVSNPRPQLVTDATHFSSIGLLIPWLKTQEYSLSYFIHCFISFSVSDDFSVCSSKYGYTTILPQM